MYALRHFALGSIAENCYHCLGWILDWTTIYIWVIIIETLLIDWILVHYFYLNNYVDMLIIWFFFLQLTFSPLTWRVGFQSLRSRLWHFWFFQSIAIKPIFSFQQHFQALHSDVILYQHSKIEDHLIQGCHLLNPKLDMLHFLCYELIPQDFNNTKYI